MQRHLLGNRLGLCCADVGSLSRARLGGSDCRQGQCVVVFEGVGGIYLRKASSCVRRNSSRSTMSAVQEGPIQSLQAEFQVEVSLFITLLTVTVASSFAQVIPRR